MREKVCCVCEIDDDVCGVICFVAEKIVRGIPMSSWNLLNKKWLEFP